MCTARPRSIPTMKTRITLIVLCLAALVGSESQARAAERYKVFDLGDVLGGNSYAQAINSRGEVVGYWDTRTNGVHAFLYSEGLFLDLGSLGGTNRYALNINETGQVVGFAETEEGVRAFVFSQGVMKNLGSFGARNSYAFGINNGGQIVG